MAVRQINGKASWKKFSAAYSEQLGMAGESLNRFAQRRLSEECEKFIKKTDSEWPHRTEFDGKTYGGDRYHPWYTGNLHDSVAVRLSQHNKTISVHYMPQKATQSQFMDEEGMKVGRIIGADWAKQEVDNASYVFLPGIQAQLIVGVPYARKVDESGRHRGYISQLTSDLFSNFIEDTIVDITKDFRYRGRMFVK